MNPGPDEPDDNEGIDLDRELSWLTSPAPGAESSASLNDPLPNPDDQSITKGIPQPGVQAPLDPTVPSTRRPGRILNKDRFLDNLRRPWSRLSDK